MLVTIIHMIIEAPNKKRAFRLYYQTTSAELPKIKERFAQYGKIFFTIKKSRYMKTQEKPIDSIRHKDGLMYYSRRKFCEMYNISGKTPYNWVNDGKAKALALDGTTFFAKVEEVKQ